LPYTKKEIKDAIIFGLMGTDNPEFKEHLKSSYILLADWLQGVGDIPEGFDFSNINENQDVEVLAKMFLDRNSITTQRLWTESP